MNEQVDRFNKFSNAISRFMKPKKAKPSTKPVAVLSFKLNKKKGSESIKQIYERCRKAEVSTEPADGRVMIARSIPYPFPRHRRTN